MIRKIIYSFLIVLSALNHMSAQNNVTITGQINGVDKGRLYVLSRMSLEKLDTLGFTDFCTPNFTIKFTAPEPVFATIVLENYQGGFDFIAEPGEKYDALLTNGNDAYIKGGVLNNKWRSFIKSSDSLKVVLSNLKSQYDEYKQNNKFRSASMINDSLMRTKEYLHSFTSNFLKENDNVISSFTMYNNAIMFEAKAEECRRLYNSLGENAKNSINGKMLMAHIENLEKTASGNKAPDFELKDNNGKSFKLSGIKGKVKIVDFWASWCGPCRLNNPNLISLYNEYHSKGLEIIGISLDNNEQRWQDAIKKDGLEWINLSSLKGWGCEVAKLYNVKAIPEMFILDENNNIIATHLRGEKLKEFIKKQFE